MGGDAGSEGMLAGVRVLDFTQYLAGPTTTRLMAELGADVIKVEQAPGGDPSRQLPLVREGRSIYFVQQNRGKRSLCVDFRQEEGAALLRELVKHVDVVVENYGPNVLDRRGLDYESLRRENPSLIMASISAFGRSGPLAGKVGFDLIAQAFSGVVHMTGDPEGPPQFVSLGVADGNAGVHAFSAIGYALFHRERTGRGQYIDISMVDSLYHYHEINVQMYANGDRTREPVRCGRLHPLVGPYGVYKAPRGWVAMLVLERQWPSLCRAMERPDLAEDPRFETAAKRGENRRELAALMEEWMATFEDDEVLLEHLEEHRVPAAPVLSVADTLKHPYFRARRMVREVPDPVLGPVTIPGFPLKGTALAERTDLRAPLLGEHNAEVLGELLGWGEERVGALSSSGALASGAV